MSQEKRVEKLEVTGDPRIVPLTSNNLADLHRRAAEVRAQGKKPVLLHFPGLNFSQLPLMPGEEPTLIDGDDNLDLESLPD